MNTTVLRGDVRWAEVRERETMNPRRRETTETEGRRDLRLSYREGGDEEEGRISDQAGTCLRRRARAADGAEESSGAW